MEEYKICPLCGIHNSSILTNCLECDTDLTNAEITQKENLLKIKLNTHSSIVSKYFLKSLDSDFRYQITSLSTTIGREAEMSDFLKNKKFVSRLHSKLTLENSTLIIENISKTNSTYVNNKKIQIAKLDDGDEIGLGGFCKDGGYQEHAAYFIVEIK